MSARITASSDSYSSTANTPTITSFTMMAWAYILSDTNTNGSVLKLGDTSNNGNFYQYGYDSTSTNSRTFAWNNANLSTGATISLNRWYHFCQVVSGNSTSQCLNYLNGVLDITIDGRAAVPSTGLMFGNDPGAGWANCLLAAVKVFDGVLTLNEVLAEMPYYQPVNKRVRCNRWHKLRGRNDVRDYAGRGNLLTINGSPGIGQDPPGVIDLDDYRPRRRVSAPAAAAVPARAAVMAGQEPHWSQIYEKWAGRRSPGIYPEPATLSRKGRRQRRSYEESLRRSPVRLAA